MKRKSSRLLFKSFLCICIFWISLGAYSSMAKAEGNYLMDATLINNTESDYYSVILTVENNEKDFSGVVRMYVYKPNLTPSVYDTVISLPNNSTKQLSISIPKSCVEPNRNYYATISLIDNHKKELYSEDFTDLFNQMDISIQMGILSDNYSSLTFMDMAGRSITFYQEEYPISLVELTKDNLNEELDSLTFLVIDDYNISHLEDFQIMKIANWVTDGGTLICGISNDESNYFKTVDGFPTDLFDYDFSNHDETDFLNFVYSNNYNFDLNTINKPYGEGSTTLCLYPLTDILTNNEFPMAFVYDLLDQSSATTTKRYRSILNQKYTPDTNIKEYLTMICNNNSNFYPLLFVFILVVYIIFIGPILYVILKALKKQEYYWVAVPGGAVIMTLCIFVISHGISLSNTKIISVSMTNMDKKDARESYLLALNSGYREWSFKTNSDVRAAGPIFAKYNYNDDIFTKKYAEHVTKDGNFYALGSNTKSPFQDTFFSTVSDNIESGTIDVSFDTNVLLYDNTDAINHFTITNNTGKDFNYFVIYFNGRYQIYKNLKKGSTVYTGNLENIYNYDSMNGYFRNYSYRGYILSNSPTNILGNKKDCLSALGIGLNHLQNESFFVMGVIDDYPKISNDFSKELSYGCVYTTKINYGGQ